MFILNNCRNYRHVEDYGRFDVFFDLRFDRHGSEMASLYPNAVCCVISYLDPKATTGSLLLSFWRYRESKAFEAKQTWALVGEKIGDMIISKDELAVQAEFQNVFNVDGDFKQFSLLNSGTGKGP